MSDVSGNTASFMPNAKCKRCGWPIVIATCNDEFQNFKDAEEFDVWIYCANKGCEHHDGKGFDGKYPQWIKFRGA